MPTKKTVGDIQGFAKHTKDKKWPSGTNVLKINQDIANYFKTWNPAKAKTPGALVEIWLDDNGTDIVKVSSRNMLGAMERWTS